MGNQVDKKINNAREVCVYVGVYRVQPVAARACLLVHGKAAHQGGVALHDKRVLRSSPGTFCVGSVLGHHDGQASLSRLMVQVLASCCFVPAHGAG